MSRKIPSTGAEPAQHLRELLGEVVLVGTRHVEDLPAGLERRGGPLDLPQILGAGDPLGMGIGGVLVDLDAEVDGRTDPAGVQGLDLIAEQVEPGAQVRVPFRPVRSDSRGARGGTSRRRSRCQRPPRRRCGQIAPDRTRPRRRGPQGRYGSQGGSSAGGTAAGRRWSSSSTPTARWTESSMSRHRMNEPYDPPTKQSTRPVGRHVRICAEGGILPCQQRLRRPVHEVGPGALVSPMSGPQRASGLRSRSRCPQLARCSDAGSRARPGAAGGPGQRSPARWQQPAEVPAGLPMPYCQ